ncbi:MAG TPA: 2OG-Fe dioxygenase family protein [Methylibium sp.]|uniref:2OG-Fe dioxygenase family protein n=1 Tax=Methylibium sp. TaxID=2067992 RepID=UPI002DB8D861|nr:2OG-Fe dioxygenase family protein [Methylibium sp.]HEU4458807.1 2OG-Fe dioxygenase family protein [Methylibium sp.]
MHVDIELPLGRATALQRLRAQGFCVLTPSAIESLTGLDIDDFEPMRAYWDGLPPDAHLKDGGAYRFRRHGCFVQTLEPQALQAVPHRAHWQPTTYNALHGGMERWFEPLPPGLVRTAPWRALILEFGELFARLRAPEGGRWYVEAHPFRIDTAQGVGRPTPEGAHRDGVDFVAVVFVGRHGVRGGESRVFEADGPLGVRFTLEQPWTTLLLDDERVIHESTPIQPADPEAPGQRGTRDTLVLTYRAGGFQAPPA